MTLWKYHYSCNEHGRYMKGCPQCQQRVREFIKENHEHIRELQNTRYKRKHDEIRARVKELHRLNPEKYKQKRHEYVDSHHARINELQRESYYRHRASRIARMKAGYRLNHAKYREAANKSNQELHIAALQKLGGKCVKCGVDDLRIVNVNHLLGGGTQHFRERGAQGIYLDIVQDKVNLKDYDVRCANHNILYEHEQGRRTWILPNHTFTKDPIHYHADRTRFSHQTRRLQAIEILGGRCVDCKIDDPRILAVNHIEGKGTREFKTLGPKMVYKQIIEHLELRHLYDVRCANHNLLYEYQVGRRHWFQL